MKPVLFVSGLGQTLNRTENLKTIYDAYKGQKKFISIYDPNFQSEIRSGKYDLQVIDVFPKCSPGKTIMIWHAIQGGKHIGLDERDTYYKPEYANLIDIIVAAGHGAIPLFSQCTGVPAERILPLGMPRTDDYIGKHKGDGGTILSRRRAYLYVPTYRTKAETPLPDVNWAWLNEQLTDNELLVVKAHPFTKELKIHNYQHIMEISGTDPTTPYLYDADVVITDYSSIMFDAYLLDKPVVLFEKNPGYTGVRGMYLDYPLQYCSRFAITEEGMLNMMRFANSITQTEKSCINSLADMCDGHSCERICNLIDTMNGGDT